MGHGGARRQASPETQLRALKKAARKVVRVDKAWGEELRHGTVEQERDAQKNVWEAISELRKVLERYGR